MGAPTQDDATVVIADAKGVIRCWSPGAERAFGYPAAQAIGQTLDLIVPPEFREAHWAGFQRTIAAGGAPTDGQTVPFPVQLVCGDVDERPGRLTLIRAPHGEVVAAAVAFDSGTR
jgi:PAS domain S-box-containing protein